MFRNRQQLGGAGWAALTLCLYMAAPAAMAKPLARDQAVYEQYLDFGSLVKGGALVPNWMPDGSSFWYVDGEPNNRQILTVDPAKNSVTPFFDVTRLRQVLEASLGHPPIGTGVPFDQVGFLAPRKVGFSVEGASYELDLDTYKLNKPLPLLAFGSSVVRSEAERAVPGTFLREPISGGGKYPMPEAMSPDGHWIASIESNNLMMRATVDGQKIPFTDDGSGTAGWDLETVRWNPWSADGQHLAIFKQYTEGMVRSATIEWLKPIPVAREFLTTPAGGTLYRVELYLVDMYTQKPKLVDLGDTTDQFVRVLTWRPDGSELIIARYNRILSRVDILGVNAVTRAVRTIMTEESPTFITNHHEAIWGNVTGFTLLPDGSGFVWASKRSGWNHLYYYDMKGKLVRELTRGAWPVKEVLRVDQAGGWVYFTAHGDQKRPYDLHLYRVGLDGKAFHQLTQGVGQHTINLAPSAKYFTDSYSSVDVPPRTVLRAADGTQIRDLAEADISALRAVGWVPPKEYVVKAADGTTDLWVTMYFPYNFDPGKKYPVVEYIYGGPQTSIRVKDFSFPAGPPFRVVNFNRALANLGAIVLTLDSRGTSDRSKAFQDAIYKNWGTIVIQDHVAGLRELAARLPFMDLDRVGVWGASWGGHFAFRALTQAPELYKVGIVEAPGFDPHDTILYEAYLGMPQQNKAAYDAADTFALAPKLKGELLLVGGMNDTGTQGDLFRMSEILIRLGKLHQVSIYPYSAHGANGRTAEYDMEVKKRFFLDHLLNPTQP